MTREELEKRRGELNARLAQLVCAQTLVRGALMEVEEWLGRVTEAEKGAMVGDTTAPLTTEKEATTNDGSDESGINSVHPAEARVSD